MEDDLKNNGRKPQKNGRLTQFKKNGRRPQKKI